MTKRLAHVDAAMDEAIRLNASFDYEVTSKNIVVVLGCNGKIRKVFMSRNHKNRTGTELVRRDIRKQIEEMRK